MNVFRLEWKLNRLSFIIWTAVISFMLTVCIAIYPEMSSQMDQMNEMFADMGAFTAAFGMDQLNFGEFSGYFGVECGNVLGMFGAFFAGILGIGSLAKEERDHTAEFLLTHPISRTRIMLEKLLSLISILFVMNLAVMCITGGAILAIGAEMELKQFFLLFLSYFLLQVQIVVITFSLSSFLRTGSFGLGLGIAATFYFLNIVSNLTEEAEFLKYLTPFSYADAPSIIADGAIPGKYFLTGVLLAVISLVAALLYYPKKDVL